MAAVQLARDKGYVLRVSASELGRIQDGLTDLAKLYEQHAGGDTEAWFRATAAEIRALRAAIDPGNGVSFEGGAAPLEK